MQFGDISYQVTDEVATIAINRPERRNACRTKTLKEIVAALAQAEADDGVRAVVLTGVGDKAFTSGLDMTEWELKSVTRYYLDEREFLGVFFAIQRLGKPLIIRVNGLALGGSLGWVALADFVVAVDTAKFGAPQIKGIGNYPAALAPLLVQRIGFKKARHLLLLGTIIDAAQAEQFGLVDVVVPRDQLDAGVRQFTDQFRALSATGVRFGVEDFRQREVDAPALWEALKTSSLSLGTADAAEGVAAFFAKREPKWTHK